MTRKILNLFAGAAVVAVLGASAQASSVSITNAGINYGDDANYGIVSVGSKANLNINSGPNTGNVLVGQGSVVTTSGGGNGALIGTINYDNTFTAASIQSAFSGLQNAPGAGQFVSVTPGFTNQAFKDAQSLSDLAKGLTADTTLVNLTSDTTFNALTGSGADGVDVIDVTNIQNANIILSGNASSVFVFNVSGTYQTNQTLTLEGGVQTTNVLFNFTGTSGNVFQTSGGDTSVGVYLATDGGDFQFSNLHLTGNLINTGGKIQLVSGSRMFSPLVTVVVPLPPAVWSGMALMGVMGAFAMKSRGARRAV